MPARQKFRPRYNDKARNAIVAGTPRSAPRKPSKPATPVLDAVPDASDDDDSHPDSMQEMAQPSTDSVSRNSVIQDPILGDIRMDSMSSKKRKRMEKFIERKLKKEERVQLIASLAKSSVSSDLFLSSRQMGQPVASKREKLRRSLLGERYAVPHLVDGSVRLRYGEQVESDGAAEDSSGADEDTADEGDMVPCVSVSAVREPAVSNAGSVPVCVTTPVLVPKVQDSAANPVKYHPQPSPVTSASKACFVPIHRSEANRLARAQLPVVAEEYQIMEHLSNQDVLILCAETGSGKTTQVPQFLYESGYGSLPEGGHPGKIGVTQPRRVAAMSMAQRVAHEMSLSLSQVSYLVRYEGTVNPQTVIQFMTDGVLLREVSRDFLLLDYSCIIVDEAHERSLNTDILIGLLSRIVLLRRRLASGSCKENVRLPSGRVVFDVKPLKLIIMSATLRVHDFADNARLFPNPPTVMNIPGRTHPVANHFSRRTKPDYMTEAFKKVCKIHTRLPPGGILVFVTGQSEVLALCSNLRKMFQRGSVSQAGKDPAAGRDMNSNALITKGDCNDMGADSLEEMTMEADADEWLYDDLLEDDVDDDDGFEELEVESDGKVRPLHILPLYSLLSSEKQMQIFKPPVGNARLCVVSTNIAETSLTIPNIRYVVDCGRVKQRCHDFGTNTTSFEINWISRASAEQRSGRAGRTGPGHCYRLYSSAMFANEFEQFTLPEILRLPIESVVLQMKNMNIENIINFPYPSPPTHEQLENAETHLIRLQALHPETRQITNLGRQMALFPILPRFSRMILSCLQADHLVYIIYLAAILTIGDPRDHMNYNLDDDDKRDENDEQLLSLNRINKTFGAGTMSDPILLLRLFGAYQNSNTPLSFCTQHRLRLKAMKEVALLAGQLSMITLDHFPNAALARTPEPLRPFKASTVKHLQKSIVLAFVDQVALRVDKLPDGSRPDGLSYRTLVSPKSSTIEKEMSHLLTLHPNSVISPDTAPDLLAYGELFAGNLRTYMKMCTWIPDKGWLPELGPTLCTFSKPLAQPKPHYDERLGRVRCWAMASFGNARIEMAPAEMDHPVDAMGVRLFAQALVQGLVFPEVMKTWTKWLAYDASLLANPRIAIHHSKVVVLVQPLLEKKIVSQQSLEKVWSIQENFLLSSLLTWYQSEGHDCIKNAWPPRSVCSK